MATNADGLTARQAQFVDEYLIDLNATQAAIRAGYSERGADVAGHRLLADARIASLVAKAQAGRTKRTKVDQDWIVKMARRNALRALQAEEIRDSTGRPTGVYKYEGSVVNGALALLAKHTGGFSDKVELTGKDGGAVVVQFVREGHKRTAG